MEKLILKNIIIVWGALLTQSSFIQASQAGDLTPTGKAPLTEIFGAKASNTKREKLTGSGFENTHNLGQLKLFLQTMDIKKAIEEVLKANPNLAGEEREIAVWANISKGKKNDLKSKFTDKLKDFEVNKLVNKITQDTFKLRWIKEGWENFTPKVEQPESSASEDQLAVANSISQPTQPLKLTSPAKIKMVDDKTGLTPKGKVTLSEIFGERYDDEKREKLNGTSFTNTNDLQALKEFLQDIDLAAARDQILLSKPSSEPTDVEVWGIISDLKKEQVRVKFGEKLTKFQINKLVNKITQISFLQKWNLEKSPDAITEQTTSLDIHDKADLSRKTDEQDIPADKLKDPEPASSQQKPEDKKIATKPEIGSDASKEKETFIAKYRNTLLTVFAVTVATMWLYSKYRHVDTQHTAAAA